MKKLAIQLAVVISLSWMLAACVTTTEGALYNRDVDIEDAVDRQVDAAKTYLKKGDSENALRHLRRAKETAPRSSKVLGTMAYAYELSRDYDLAESHYVAAIKGDEPNTATVNNYAVFLYKQERYERAERFFKKVVADTLYEQRGNGYVSLGMAQLKQGKITDAEQSFERGLVLRSSLPLPLLSLAEATYKAGDYPKSKRYYMAFRRQSKQTASSLLLGLHLAEKTNDKQAYNDLTRALKNLYPDSPEYQRFKRQSGQL